MSKKLFNLVIIWATMSTSPAAQFTLTAPFDYWYGDPSVGTATLAYDAPAALTNGVYAWTSLDNLSFTAIFSEIPVTFTEADLLADLTPANTIFVAVADNEFFFASDTPNDYGVAALFQKDGYLLLTEWIDSVTMDSLISGSDYAQPVYQVRDAQNTIYIGFYGADSREVLVPEPATYGLLTLAAIVFGGRWICRRGRVRAAGC